MGSKNVVLKFLSVNNIVMAPAKTGNDNNNKKTVINNDHKNKGIFIILSLGVLILITETIKFIAPAIELAPAICKEKIAISTLGPG